MIILSMLFFGIFAAFAVAKLEINIEGKEGWAKSLPTYRFRNRISRFLIGDTEMTGYHIWLNTTLILLAHFPFFAGLPWSITMELKILGIFFIIAMLEDFFWFIFNPYYGFRKFNKQHISWHKWVGIFPMLYFIYSLLGLSLIILSFYL